jgi:5-(aminomethyl)-3-furanmethanol phosphate kinase
MRCLSPEGSRCFWDRAMWVVKLGGSLHDDAPALRRWLRSLAEVPGPRRVVVPGGGPFADAVRGLQPAMGFGDLAAHRMAILAMQQLGLALQSLEPRLALAETEAELRAGPASVWLPWRLAGREETIAASWDVTSDSLACWLAARLGAAVLFLVKSGPVPTGEATAEALAAAGLVDAAFPALAQRFAGSIRVLHRDGEFPGLSGAGPAGCRVAR